jgi:hypothetical protein
MNEALERRILRLRPTPLDVPRGVLIMPMPVPPRLWMLSMLIERVRVDGRYADLVQCPDCGYPRDPAPCASCAIGYRSPEPRTVTMLPPHGVFRVPFDWTETRFLRMTQFSWCVAYDTTLHNCAQCDHALAVGQRSCLICLDRRLRGET